MKRQATRDKRHAFCQGLVLFAKRYKFSIRRLSIVCGGSQCGFSLSSAGRVMRGWRKLWVRDSDYAAIIEHIKFFLASQGKTPPQIDHELKRTFLIEEVQNKVITEKTALPFETQQYFRLKFDPFTDPRSAKEVFTCRPLDRIASSLEDVVRYQGFVGVIGEVGSGKSLMKRRLCETMAQSQKLHLLWPKFFDMDRVHSGAITNYLLEHFEQKVRRGLVANARQLEQFLAGLSEQGISVAIGFDECHHLSDSTLLALKNFYELGTGGYDKYLGIVLFGQPRFKSRLQDYRFREIAERLRIIEMPTFKSHAWDYVAHRIKSSGGDAEKLFERPAVTRLADQATTPLALGNLVNASLVKAHQLNERKVHKGILSAMLISEEGEPRVRALRRG